MIAVITKGWVIPTSIVMLGVYTNLPVDRMTGIMILGYATLIVSVPLTRSVLYSDYVPINGVHVMHKCTITYTSHHT